MEIRLDNAFLFSIMRRDVPAAGLLKDDPNPIWDKIIQLSLTGYVFRQTRGQSYSVVTPPEWGDFEFLDINDIVKFCGADTGSGQLGQEVLGFPSWLKIPDANINDQVPAWLINPYVLNPDGTPTATRKTWTEWGIGIRAAGGFSYIALNGGGSIEPGSTIARIANLIVTQGITGAAVMSPEEVAAEIG